MESLGRLKICCAGQFRLATLVQYVPLPVVAGYLAFVGLFCLQAGLALAAGVEVGYVSGTLRLSEAHVKPLTFQVFRAKPPRLQANTAAAVALTHALFRASPVPDVCDHDEHLNKCLMHPFKANHRRFTPWDHCREPPVMEACFLSCLSG